MFTRMRTPIAVITAAAVAGTGLLLATGPTASAAPATAAGVDKGKAGPCSKTSFYEFELEKEHGRIEIEFEVKSRKAGQTWNVRLGHNGTPVMNKKRVTKADGDFTAVRVVTDQAGKDRVGARATNARTGEVCRVKLSI